MQRPSTFLLSVAFTLSVISPLGCDSIQNAIYKSGIEKALHEDALTGKEPTSGHISAMRSVDLANCPPEFREAYMKHIHAWEEEVQVHDAKLKLDSEEGAAAAAGGLATLFGSDATPWADHVQAAERLQRYETVASTDVSSTFQQVEEIASKYGAQVPR